MGVIVHNGNLADLKNVAKNDAGGGSHGRGSSPRIPLAWGEPTGARPNARRKGAKVRGGGYKERESPSMR